MKNVFFVVTIKQPIVFSKKPIVFPLATLFVLLVYSITILIFALYNPSHCLFVDQIGGEVYA